jgi:folylpolyglutamate synthase
LRGRSLGASFLGSMLKNTAEQLELYKSEETSSGFFDTVIFCTNITYADGHFKGGAYFFFVFVSAPL